MNLAKIYATLALCILTLQGCSNAFSPSVTSSTPAKAVALQGSQQGQSGGLADYDGDGMDDMMVGAPYAKSDGTVGAVLIYKGSANGFDTKSTWILTGDDNFGFSLVNLGDVDGDGKADFAVGAYNGDGADVSLSGSVTIYKGGGSGKVIAKLAGDDALDKFGLSISGGCDLNGDGIKDIIIGAPYNSPAPERYQGGAVYVYFGPDFKETTRIKLPASTTSTGIGGTVACGDLNNDGIGDLIVGASGKVQVYYGKPGLNPSTSTPDLTITSSDSKFGTALAVIKDLNGDGFNELVIGAPQATVSLNSINTARVGRVYIVKGGSGTRTINLASPGSDILTRINGAGYFDFFGSTITPVGDMDGDGKPDLAIAAINADKDGATSVATGLTSGKVYLIKGKDLKTDGGVTPITGATAFNGSAANMRYGTFMAPFTRNGPKLLVGAPTVNRQSGCIYGISLEEGSSVMPAFQADGSDNSTTGHDCCAKTLSKGGKGL
ncbi:FG-GAP-like repeat-containing protein [Pelotalea chapellei]|uniref:Integrin alpha n=1 Tax=Pelotalea chapellei TaxID=44671 RepID=A0ABS5UC00_9BACT|nr:FG-GAP-like repeat-containing protein [Pelotalea chapellei]MBT1073176.1 integrin alpha [Pelotalea chapellei]